MSKKIQNRAIKPPLFFTPQSYFLIGQGQTLVAVESLKASRYALARYPLKQEDSPRHADYLVVAGPINRRYRMVIARLGAQLARPGNVVHLESPAILPGASRAGYVKPPESTGYFFTPYKQTSAGLTTTIEPMRVIETLHNELIMPPTFLSGMETGPGPGTLVPLRSFEEKELATEDLTLSLGPAHPALYGPLRLVLTLDGEQVAAAEADPGYAYRGLEKLAEDREPSSAPAFGAVLDALAPLSGTVSVTMALEKMAAPGLAQVPLRAGFLRVVALELERMASHLFAQARILKTLDLHGPAHKVLDLYGEVSESLRLVCGEPTWRFIVPGGVRSDINANLLSHLTGLVRQLQAWVRQELGPEASRTLANRIFRYSLGSRMEGLGVIGPGEAVELGFTGPNLRASGSTFDWRSFSSQASAALPYNELGFKPTFSRSGRGDAYSRYRLRIEEIAASSALVALALKHLPAGSTGIDLDLDKAFLHSKFEGNNAGPGEAAGIVESPRGLLEVRLALTLNSAGKTVIERLHFRSPSWPHFQALPGLITGARLPDALAIINSLDVAPDEAER